MNFEISFLAMCCILFFSTSLRSTFGFGDAVIAMPLLALFMDLKMATPLFALSALTISSIILLKKRKHLQIIHVKRLVISTAIGIPIGIYLLREINENIIKLILGIIVIFFSVYNLWKPALNRITKDSFAYMFGFIAGILGGAYNVNGPPVVCYASLKNWDPSAFLATLQGYFFLTGIFLVGSHGIVGNITLGVLQYYLLLIPVITAGIVLGNQMNKKMRKQAFVKYLHIIMLILGFILIITSLPT